MMYCEEKVKVNLRRWSGNKGEIQWMRKARKVGDRKSAKEGRDE